MRIPTNPVPWSIVALASCEPRLQGYFGAGQLLWHQALSRLLTHLSTSCLPWPWASSIAPGYWQLTMNPGPGTSQHQLPLWPLVPNQCLWTQIPSWAQHLANYHDHRSLTHPSSSLAHVELDSRPASVGPESGPPSCTQAPGWSLNMRASGLPTCWPRHHTCLPHGSSSKLACGNHLMCHPESLDGLTGEGLCLLKHVVKTRRSAHFLKCADSSVSHKDHESSGKHDTIKGN